MPIDHQANKSTATNDVPLMVEKYDGIAWLTLNRPRQYNALSSALLDHLHTAFDDIGRDPCIRVAVIAATGHAFCAGHDLKEMQHSTDPNFAAQHPPSHSRAPSRANVRLKC